jgi:hypothetical protein
MRGGVTGVVTALLLVLGLPSAGAAQAPLPVGEADGVRIVRERGALVVVFTQRAEKLRRKVAGKHVSVLCTEFTDFGTHGGGITQRAPRRGRKIYTGDGTRGMDYCRVWIAARTVTRDGERRRIRRKLVVSVPLTQTGAVFLDEQEKAITVLGLLTIAALIGEDRNISGAPTPAELLDAVPGFQGLPARAPVVPLATPSDTPAAPAVGYYSDGESHVAGVIVSASGRRLFVEYQGDVLHTNVARYIFGGID